MKCSQGYLMHCDTIEMKNTIAHQTKNDCLSNIYLYKVPYTPKLWNSIRDAVSVNNLLLIPV